jgi:hypothetical protein
MTEAALSRAGVAWVAATLCLGFGAPALAAPPQPGPSGLHVIAEIPGPDGGWDLASFDPARRRLYVAHGTQVMLVEADTGKVTPNFAPGDRLHSVVAIPGTDLIATTNGGDATVKVVNADTGAVIASAPMAPDPDSAIFDPQSGRLLVMGGDSALISLVDVRQAKVEATIPVGGALEFPALDGKGTLYVNNEALAEIDVIDLAARKVVGRYPMAGCEKPSGLAYVAGGRLVSACRNGLAKILDAASGREIASLSIGKRPDAVLYDPKRALAMIPSAESGTLTVIALAGPDDNAVIDTVPTAVGARTGAVDVATGRVYLPVAELEPPAAPGERPKPKPGTFRILVLDR